jgi:hypothetical protein
MAASLHSGLTHARGAVNLSNLSSMEKTFPKREKGPVNRGSRLIQAAEATSPVNGMPNIGKHVEDKKKGGRMPPFGKHAFNLRRLLSVRPR